jgi:Na+-driven multidrug efflux pump
MMNLYSLAFGMNISTSALVGIELGKENPAQAKKNGHIA